VAVLASVALLGAACGSDSGNAASPAPAKGADTSALGPANQANGTPVKVGFVTSESGTVDIPESRKAAEATARYANAHLGGLGGHPIQLVTCKDKGDGASATACANRFVEEKVVAVTVGQVPNPDLYIPILATASIPWIVEQGAGRQEIGAANAFILTGGSVSIFNAAAAFLADNGKKKALVLGIDVPAFTGLFNALGKPSFAKVGVEVNLVPVPVDAPDVTSLVAAGMAKHPDAILVFGGGTQCKALLPAIHDANADDAQVLMPGPCATAEVFDAVGHDIVEGVVVYGNGVALSGVPDSGLYKAIMATYASGTSATETAGIGFASMLGLVRAVNVGAATSAAPTAASISSALRAAKSVPLPGYPTSSTFTCDGSASSFKALCSTWTLLAEVHDGNLANFKALK
jgi:branched-chain amino acid transport system substrate-binding protein